MINKYYKILTFIVITAVIIAGIILPLADIIHDKPEDIDIGAFKTAADFRSIFFHVPQAWLAVLSFMISMLYSVKYLRNNNFIFDIKASSAAQIGFIFCILATITGSLWAKFRWNAFWNWDPRETSIFILLLVYGAYFSLRSAIENEEKKAKLSSVYSIISFITVPFFIFVMPRIVYSNHPKDTVINSQGKINMDTTYLLIFISSLIGFTLLFFWIYNIKTRFEILKYKKLNKY
jgi:heme exporter protein C